MKAAVRLGTAMILLAAGAATTNADSVLLRLELHLSGGVPGEVLDAELLARSTPGNPLFRRHLSAAELRDRVAAPADRQRRVVAALQAAGATSVRLLGTGDVVMAEVRSVAVAERLAISAFDVARVHAVTDGYITRVEAPVPSVLRADVRLAIIGPSRDAGPPTRRTTSAERRSKLRLPMAASREVPTPLGRFPPPFPGMTQTPPQLRARYKVPAGPVPAAPNVTQAVAEFQWQYMQQKDINTFAEKFGFAPTTIQFNGENKQSEFVEEGTMDVEYITTVADGVPTSWVSRTDFNLQLWGETVLKMDPIPSVISISFSKGEAKYPSRAVVMADEAVFRKIALRGVSVLTGSGDNGPGARYTNSCTKFQPGYPATSQYVTSVGATFATKTDAPEASVWFSGGGFSNLFPMPVWQRAAVGRYLANSTGALPAASFFNRTGRAFPDVAALGTNYLMYGPPEFWPRKPATWRKISGTSCSTPTFAAVISRLNAERAAAGKPVLGFLNPALYRLGKAGNDITAGHSIFFDCMRPGAEVPEIMPGFGAAAGWDAVSGLGTPDFAFLAANL